MGQGWASLSAPGPSRASQPTPPRGYRNQDNDTRPWCFVWRGDRLSWNYCRLARCQAPAPGAPQIPPPIRISSGHQYFPLPSLSALQKPQPTTQTPLRPLTSGSWERLRIRAEKSRDELATFQLIVGLPALSLGFSHRLVLAARAADSPAQRGPGGLWTAAPQTAVLAEPRRQGTGGAPRGASLHRRAVAGPEFLQRQPHRPLLGADRGSLPAEPASA